MVIPKDVVYIPKEKRKLFFKGSYIPIPLTFVWYYLNFYSMWKLISNIKDWVVADNKGLHFALAYIWFDIIYLLNIPTAFISTIFFIVLMEIIDKKKIKTKFSLIDVVSGIIGMILSYVINTI